MLIQSLEQKTKLALMTVVLTLAACTVICIFTVYQSSKLVSEERSQIYILDGDIPFLAERSLQEANFVMEAKAHIQLFHQYFFNLPPDDDYIKWTLGKALYMADGTAMKQKQACILLPVQKMALMIWILPHGLVLEWKTLLITPTQKFCSIFQIL